MKRTPIKRGDSQLKRTRLKQRSTRRIGVAEERKVMREAGPRGCVVGEILEAAGIGPRCRHRVEGLHERRKAGAAGSLLNEANLIPSCNPCNGWLEDYPDLVREHTGTALVVREGDPEWESLSKRHDRFR